MCLGFPGFIYLWSLNFAHCTSTICGSFEEYNRVFAALHFHPSKPCFSMCSSHLSSYLFSYCYFVSALNLYSGADLSWGCMVSFSLSKWVCVMCWQDECTIPESEDSSPISLTPLMRLDENYKVEVGNDTIIYINVCRSLLPVQGLSCLGGSSACVARIHNGSLIDEKV